MKIGIIVYSQTGNTYSVCLRLQDKLLSLGHSVRIERLEVVGGYQSGMKSIKFKKLPDVGKYDALFFGSPVQAFSLSPVMVSYLNQIKSLKDKKVAFLVTQFFPYPWMGGNRAVGQIKKICKSKGAVVCGSGVVNWMNESRREKKILKAVEELEGVFGL